MKERRKRIMKRLLIEELERRTMLNGTEIAMASTGLTSNSYEDVYKSVVGTESGGPAGVGMLSAALNAPRFGQFAMGNSMNIGVKPGESFPGANTGVGQMTITTGANTPGISSFATPTAGPSHAGGTGNAAFGPGTGPVQVNTGAVDQAINELSLELPHLAMGKAAKKAETSDWFEQNDKAVEKAQQEWEQAERVRAETPVSNAKLEQMAIAST